MSLSDTKKVHVIGLGFHEVLEPTLLQTETISLNDFFTVLYEKNELIKESAEFQVVYQGKKVNLTSKKSDLTKEMKIQIFAKFPILKDFEAKGKEEGKKIITSFLTSCTKKLTNRSLADMIELVDILNNKKDLFTGVTGLFEVCKSFAKIADDKIKTAKAKGEEVEEVEEVKETI